MLWKPKLGILINRHLRCSSIWKKKIKQKRDKTRTERSHFMGGFGLRVKWLG